MRVTSLSGRVALVAGATRGAGRGIATALVTTELGLIVAIPCLLLGNLLGGWADRIKDDMEKAALRTINLYKDVRGIAA